MSLDKLLRIKLQAVGNQIRFSLHIYIFHNFAKLWPIVVLIGVYCFGFFLFSVLQPLTFVPLLFIAFDAPPYFIC